MRVSSSDTICGVPAKQARELMREVRSHAYGARRSFVEQEVGVPATELFLAEGYLEPAEIDGQLVTTVRGNALANASFGRPISRAKAQIELDAFLVRVREVNNDPELMYHVAWVDLFGSMLDDSVDPVGDIDLAYQLSPKWTQENREEWTDRRLAATGRGSLGIIEQIAWGEIEIHRALKNRRAALSLAPANEPQRLGVPWKRIYER